MYSEVATRLVVTEASPAYSQAVRMSTSNGIRADATVFSYAATGQNVELRITVDESNDLHNWDDLSGTIDDKKRMDFTGIGSSSLEIKETNDLTAECFVRLKFEFVGDTVTSGTAVVAAGIDTADL